MLMCRGLTIVITTIAILLSNGVGQDNSLDAVDTPAMPEEPPVLTGPGFAGDEPAAPHPDLTDMRRINTLRALIHQNDLSGLEREDA